MMINKRLIGSVPESRKYIFLNVILQWAALLANIVMILAITMLLQQLYGRAYMNDMMLLSARFMMTGAAIVGAMLVRFACSILSARMSFLSAKAVKGTLRRMIYEKLLRLGTAYKEKVATSEIVQVAVEGVDQLETYFGSYLPQFFYSMLAPVTLFIVLCFINIPSAVVLLLGVPLIPVTIAAVQTLAKRLLAKYWVQYTTLGDTFLENLQGLTTLKIYQADAYKNDEMNREAEKFRKITMKVLTMQLNSVTVMDVIAYGGAALGIIMAAVQYAADKVSLGGGLAIVLLSADFFIPMRLLGSYFHIAMNGMAASDKIFKLLDLPERAQTDAHLSAQQAFFEESCGLGCRNLHFSYEAEREILHGVSMSFKPGAYTAIVGESGCGKSTVASILMGRYKHYSGEVYAGDVDYKEIEDKDLQKYVTYVGFDSYLFKGTIRDNLLMADESASDEQMWQVLERVNLAKFLEVQNGLDTLLDEKGSNFSGGQRQRLAMARAILHDSPIYIFDEATSNVDVESENDLVTQIRQLAEYKTVIMITHRLVNAKSADYIYVMHRGKVQEEGTHGRLLQMDGVYAKMWETQHVLEIYGNEVCAE